MSYSYMFLLRIVKFSPNEHIVSLSLVAEIQPKQFFNQNKTL